MSSKYEIDKKELSKLASLQQMSAANPSMSVWVEASAGTGKTKVLSDRVLRLLLAKVDPAKILCLTYTKAAAVEMNERIAKRLSNWAVEEEIKLKEEILALLGDNYNKQDFQDTLYFARTLFARLLDTPGGMKIQTIHSFCQDILKRFPLEAGISPYFEVLDDRSAKEILQHIKLDLLKSVEDDAENALSQAVVYLTQTISEYRFPEILNMITVNRGKIDNLLKMHRGQVDAIISLLEKKLNVSSKLSINDIKNIFMQQIDRNTLRLAIDAFSQGSTQDIDRAKTFTSVLENHFSLELYKTYKSVFLTEKGTIRSSLATKPVIKKSPFISDFMNSEAERILEAETKIKALYVLQTTSAVLYIAKNIIDNYNAYKEIYAVLDYEDLILKTKNLLENNSVAEWVLFKLDEGIDHILVDEAQDTSPNQWAIIKALTQEFFAGFGSHSDSELARSVFVVGDRKQSIYSFQGADPKEFDKMYHYFESRIQNFAKVQLDVSFRSTKAIMDCVNMLFSQELPKKGVVPDGEAINHLPYRLGEGGQVEVLPLVKEDKKEKNDYNWVLPVIREQKASLSARLAKLVAENIKKLVESKQILASKNRPVRYGDFMFLVQQRNAFVEEFVRACKSIGVQVAGVDKLKLLEQIAVQDLLSLGKFLLLPADDLSLAEVLKSPIFGLNDDDLFTLSYNRKSTLFNRILTHPDYQELAEQLKKLLNLSGFVRPFELFNYVLVKLNGRKNFIARIGHEVEDVLDEFLNLTLVFEQQHTPSLEAFITWVAQDEVIIQKEMEQGENDTVKIMTVHGSKGLQAPIVILADTTHIKNKAYKSEFLWDNDVVYFPPAAAYYDENCKNIKNANLDADFDEYRRLLYVALTRAEDRLYIAGFTKNEDADEQSWYKLIENNIQSNITLAADDKRIIYNIPQENDVKISEESAQTNIEQSYDYAAILSPAPVESPLAKPYTPSKDIADETDFSASPLADDGCFYKRGTVIHRLLQYISSLAEDKRLSAARTFLCKELPEFSAAEIQKIIDEVFNLCKKYKEIFDINSMAEVPIIGEAEGKFISAKVDRLIIKDDKVIIVDYKTNRPAAKDLSEVPPQYLNQLRTYKLLLSKIYPDKQVESYILWTNTCNMMKV